MKPAKVKCSDCKHFHNGNHTRWVREIYSCPQDLTKLPSFYAKFNHAGSAISPCYQSPTRRAEMLKLHGLRSDKYNVDVCCFFERYNI